MSSICTAAAPSAPAAVTGIRLRRYLPAVLFLCGILPGLYEFRYPVYYGFGRGFEMAAIARNVVDSGTFGNPFEPQVTGPTASNPPLYPLFLAGLMRVFGTPGFVVAAILINVLLNAAINLLLLRLSILFYGDVLPGAFAGLFWIFSMRLMPQWDTTCTMAGLMAFCVVSAADMARSRSGVRAGLLGGVVSLLNPSALLISLPWVIYVQISQRFPRRQALRYLTAVLVIIGACNLPWIVRNYRVWHAPVLRTNFGYTIYSSNNDCAQSTLYWSGRNGCFPRTHPSGNPAEARLMQTMGEVQFDHLRAADAMRWIRANPERFRQLTLARFVEFWFPDPAIVPRVAYAIRVITAISFAGIFLMVRRRQSVTLYILAASLLYPLMFYVVVSCDRYRFPLLWTSLLPAGYCVTRLCSWRPRVSLPPS
jgi:hypothetical protein